MAYSSEITFLSAFLCGCLAIGVVVQARRVLTKWIFGAGLFVLTIEAFCLGRSLITVDPRDLLEWEERRLLCLALLPGIWLCFSLIYARGNAGRFLAKWRVPLSAAFAVPLAIVGTSYGRLFFIPAAFTGKPDVILPLQRAGLALHLCLLISAVLILMNLERTYRASVGTLRWRIKFLLLGVGLLFLARLYTSSQILLFRAVDLKFESINAGALLIASALIVRSFFRQGYFSTEVYPSESVIQRSLSVLLAGIYLLVVGVFAKVVSYVGGENAFAFKALGVMAAVVGLAVLLQSDRARLWVRRLVSRHFERPQYDYRAVWKRFIEGTAVQMKQEDLCATIVRLVAEEFQALSVSIWLLNDAEDICAMAASTATSVYGYEHELNVSQTKAVISHFEKNSEPVDIEAMTDLWAVSLREKHLSEFQHGGHRVCLSVSTHGEFLGLLIVGDRVAGVPFTPQDIEMLTCVRDHAAASLLNVQLSHRITRTKEMEAFQNMAAFFVHDLKNAASTLSLTLQNLPIHYNDPAFRQDALRGVSKSVSHINHLVGRLSSLRHELNIKPMPTKLNQVVEHALADLSAEQNEAILKRLNPMPLISVDTEQISKVITNLVLNAFEASGVSSQIEVHSEHRMPWIVLTVADHGCGMSKEFIQHSLFRPFKTTKKNGLGIGMFQSKMIVEAHGGRITVDSEVGRGSTFQVFLPLTLGASGPSPTLSADQGVSQSHATDSLV